MEGKWKPVNNTSPWIRKLVMTSLCVALVLAMTLIHLNVPATNGGYIHPGDAMIYASAYLLGGPAAALAGGLGSLIADLVLGAAVYAPASLIIKALMGLVAGILMSGHRASMLRRVLGCVLASLIMVAGYAAFEGLFFGWAYAVSAIPMNLVQAVGGVAIGLPLIYLLARVPRFRSMGG